MQIRPSTPSSLSHAQASQGASAQEAVDAARAAHKAYKAQTKEHFSAKEEQRRALSGLYEGEFPAAQEETAGAKDFRLSRQLIDIFSSTPNTSPDMLANSSEMFCEDLMEDQYVDPNADLSEKRAAFLKAKQAQAQRFTEQTPFVALDDARSLTSKVKQQSKELRSSVQELRPGQSHVFTGQYGQTRSITQGLFDLSSLLLGKNIEALPRTLRKAFKKGTPDVKALVHTLVVIAHQKPDTWTQDPMATRLLDLLSNSDPAKREELVEMIPAWAEELAPSKEDSAAFDQQLAEFLDLYPLEIPDAYKSRDALLKALVPVTQEPLHHALHLMLPPSLAERVVKGQAKTVDAIIKALLEDIYTHIERQVSEDKQTDIAKAIEKLLKKWNNPHIAGLLSENGITIETLANHVEVLKQKKAESPAAFGQELGRIALSMSGQLKHDPHRFLHTLVDTNLEGIIANLLELMPPHLRDLVQGMLLSPKGDYIMKTTRRQDGLYDVEIYASGPLLHTDTFKGKWPVAFKAVAPGNINKKFFQALLQGELAAKDIGGFTSSPEQFEQLLGTLGTPSNDAAHTLSNSQLFPTQMLHYYLGSSLKNPQGQTQSPVATHLLWKYKKLKEIAHEQLQGQTLTFATIERAQGMEIAASQLLATAKSMQDLSPEIRAQIKNIEAAYEEIHHAAAATWKRHSRELRQSANAPTALQMPEMIKGQIRPHYARLKKSLDQAERRLSALPFAKSWSNAARKMILQKVFYMNDAEGARVFEALQSQFPELETVPAPVRTAYQGKLRKVFEGLHLVASKVYQALGVLYDTLHHALHILSSLLPKSAIKRIGSLTQALRQWLAQTGKQVQEKIIGYMLAPIIRNLLDETLLHHLSSFGHYYVSSMREHAELSFEIPSTTEDGEYPATHFATQFFPLTGFASLDQVTLTVEDHKITSIQLPGIEGPFLRQQDGDKAEFVHATLGRLAKQQHDPRLAAFSPCLRLETTTGKNNVVIRESLAPEQLAGFISENTLGSFLWNGIKPLLGLGNAPGALHLCSLEDKHLSSNNPDALLYIMRSYLMRNEEKLAYLAFKQFEQQVQANPNLMPQDLAKHLLPLTLAPNETAAKIRLSLFAMLEDPAFDEARQQDPLYGLLWIVMSKDLVQASSALEDARFPKLKAQAPALQQAMLSRMEEHLPFYTSEEMAELVKKLFSLRGTVSPGILKTILEKAVVNLKPAAGALMPPNMQPPAQPQGLMSRALNAVVQNEVSQLPTLIRQAPHLIPKLVEHVPCTEREEDLLKSFFAGQKPATTGVLPQLTSNTLKSHFWLYYSAFYNECMYYDGVRREVGPDLATALKLPLILLEQEVAADPEAAILVRLLTTLMQLSEDPSGDVLVRLEQLHPNTLQRLLQNKEQGVDALVAQLKKLLAIPEQVKAAEALSRQSLATQIGVGALSGYHSAMQTVSSAVQTVSGGAVQAAQNVKTQIHQKTAAFFATGAQYMQRFGQAFVPEVIEGDEFEDDGRGPLIIEDVD